MAPRTLFQAKPYPFPALFGSHELEDHTLTGSIPLPLWLQHEGYQLTEKGKTYQLHLREETNQPQDTLVCRINSYRGISLGAIHWYGELALPRVQIQEVGTRNGRFWLDEKTPLQKLKLHRRIQPRDIAQDRENTFRGSKPGDWTYKFNTILEITNRAINIARTHFPGFKLLQEYEGRREALSIPPLPMGDTLRKPDPRQGSLF